MNPMQRGVAGQKPEKERPVRPLQCQTDGAGCTVAGVPVREPLKG